MMVISLIRHGATQSNYEHRYLGTTDEPLSEEGRERLAIQARAGRYGEPKLVFTSPMIRCRESADILFPRIGRIVIPEWTEIDFGAFEGKNYQDLKGDADYQAWIDSGGSMPFPNGESREGFVERVMRGLERALSAWRLQKDSSGGIYVGSGQAAAETWELEACAGKTADIEIAAVVHGGTIMALCSSLCGGEYFDYQAECGEGYRVALDYVGREIKLRECEKL
ncbi:MAG: histidine phosphatase family protein [Butyrivibrio sp.]|nr:histidine phosphatase family protein [Muribaculum sp.]MCM1552106.1 histidine phosphatase family protein [Butyrivibrio sp.]